MSDLRLLWVRLFFIPYTPAAKIIEEIAITMSPTQATGEEIPVAIAKGPIRFSCDKAWKLCLVVTLEKTPRINIEK